VEEGHVAQCVPAELRPNGRGPAACHHGDEGGNSSQQGLGAGTMAIGQVTHAGRHDAMGGLRSSSKAVWLR